MSFQKLVRDNIPAIMKSKGQTPIVRTLDEQEYKAELLKKLVEEANELLEAPGDINERADIAEVLRAIDEAFVFEQTEIEAVRRAKEQERGGFSAKIYLEGAE